MLSVQSIAFLGYPNTTAILERTWNRLQQFRRRSWQQVLKTPCYWEENSFGDRYSDLWYLTPLVVPKFQRMPGRQAARPVPPVAKLFSLSISVTDGQRPVVNTHT